MLPGLKVFTATTSDVNLLAERFPRQIRARDDGTTEEEHTQHIKWVLGKLREHKFDAHLWKCHFYKRELEYLGHLVGNNGLKVDPKKVVAVQNWPVPQDVGQIRSFLGLANYFCQFLENYSTVVAPLTVLTRKSSAW
ncbi:hypothetical protein CLOM_g10173, partial [Closterium sp. NIES-68]